jgi:predicted amidohydrolase
MVKERISEMVKEAKQKDSAIVCLPEHWIPGNKPDMKSMVSFLKTLAKENRINIISGADFYSEDKRTTVRSVVISKDGKILGMQSKVHLFGREKLLAEPGDVYNLFDIQGIKTGIAICHDLVYPEVARIFAIKGAELIFSPAKIIYDGLGPWHLYIKARALENRIPIVSPNCCGNRFFRGGSLIVGLKSNSRGIVYPEVLAEAGKEECVLIADIDTESIRKFREERLAARRVDTYSQLTA